MQLLLTALLLIAPALAVVYLLTLWIAQQRRVRALERQARELGMGFSRDDLFDLPLRYGTMALIGGGHSPWAANVTHGHVEGLAVRRFDLRLEAGHGPRRLVRPYGISVVETQSELPPLILWSNHFAEDAPLGARQVDASAGDWSIRGEPGPAQRMHQAVASLAQRLVCVELQGSVLMAAAVAGQGDYGLSLPELATLVAAAREVALRPDRDPA